MAWPVLEMSWPAPAVVWQAPRSGATPKNASKIRLESVILLYMEITLLRGPKEIDKSITVGSKLASASNPTLDWGLPILPYRQHAHDERGHELNVADCRMTRGWPRPSHSCLA